MGGVMELEILQNPCLEWWEGEKQRVVCMGRKGAEGREEELKAEHGVGLGHRR